MGRLVVHHEHEGFVLVSLIFEPSEGFIGDDVGDVAAVLGGSFFGDEVGVVVFPLAGKHVPVVKSLHFPSEVNLANHRGLVIIFLQNFSKIHLVVVELPSVGCFAIEVAMFTGEQDSAAGCADRVGDVATVKPHSLVGDPVDVWGRIELLVATAIGSNGLE